MKEKVESHSKVKDILILGCRFIFLIFIWFEYVCHDLLIKKLHAHELYHFPPWKKIQDYLLNRKQKIKIGSSLSTEEITLSGVPQGSILGPFLFYVTCFWKMKVVVSLNMKTMQSLMWPYSRNIRESCQYYLSVTHLPCQCHPLWSTQKEANIQIANTKIKWSKSKKSY